MSEYKSESENTQEDEPTVVELFGESKESKNTLITLDSCKQLTLEVSQATLEYFYKDGHNYASTFKKKILPEDFWVSLIDKWYDEEDKLREVCVKDVYSKIDSLVKDYSRQRKSQLIKEENLLD